jgi:hypothetical protein
MWRFFYMEVSIILDWIFEGIANWVASVVTSIMDAVSGIFLNALGTDMAAMAVKAGAVGGKAVAKVAVGTAAGGSLHCCR